MQLFVTQLTTVHSFRPQLDNKTILNKVPLLRAYRNTPSSSKETSAARAEKKISNIIGVNMQPCLTSPRMWLGETWHHRIGLKRIILLKFFLRKKTI